MAKSRSRDLADIIGKKSIYTSNHADVSANNGVTLSQISIDLNAVESKITNDTSTLASNTYVNSQISSTQSNIDVETDRIDLVNSNLTASNTAIRSLISSNDGDISTLQGRATALETEDGDLWTGLTGTNTAIRSLVSDQSARVDVLNTNLTGTNTAIRSLISSNDGDITALQGNVSDLETEDTNLWSAITSTNTAIRGVISSEVSGLVDSAPATLDTLNELADALGDDANFATTLTTNLGQKLGASATVTLTGDVTGSGSFSSNTASFAVSISDDFASNAHLSSTYVSNTAFQAYAANNNYVFTELAYTATAGQQSFTGVDDFGTTLDYTAGKISVFMNGIMLLAGSDYEAANTTSVWLSDGAAADDVVSVQTYSSAANFVDVNADISTASATLSGTTAQTIDTFGTADARTVKYLVEIEDTVANEFHSMEVLLTHDGTNVVLSEYATVTTGASELGSVDASITGSTLTVTCTPTVSSSAVKVVKLATVA